jgi:hypothetical protein
MVAPEHFTERHWLIILPFCRDRASRDLRSFWWSHVAFSGQPELGLIRLEIVARAREWGRI